MNLIQWLFLLSSYIQFDIHILNVAMETLFFYHEHLNRITFPIKLHYKCFNNAKREF